jgi:hypothetical protein
MSPSLLKRIGLLGVLLAPMVLLAQPSGGRQSKPVYIGFLDDARLEMANWKPGVALDRVVRPAFQKNGNGWSSVSPKSFPNRISWTVGFDGKSIGKLESTSVTNSNARGPLVDLTLIQAISSSPLSIPSVGHPQEKYAPLGMGPTKGRRPLVLVSEPYVSDPDAWKRMNQPPPEIETKVRSAFRRQFPHVTRCKDEVVVQRNWRFPDSALRIISAYASNKGSFLIEVLLAAGDCGYVDDPRDWGAGPWYFVTPHGEARWIGAFMSLLDAADYDNDGNSEVVFMIEQPEDTEGFALFDAELRKRASLLWTYH